MKAGSAVLVKLADFAHCTKVVAREGDGALLVKCCEWASLLCRGTLGLLDGRVTRVDYLRTKPDGMEEGNMSPLPLGTAGAYAVLVRRNLSFIFCFHSRRGHRLLAPHFSILGAPVLITIVGYTSEVYDRNDLSNP